MKHFSFYKLLTISLVVLSFYSCKKEETSNIEEIEFTEIYNHKFDGEETYRDFRRDGEFIFYHIENSAVSTSLVKINATTGEVVWKWSGNGTSEDMIRDFKISDSYVTVQIMSGETFLLDKDNGNVISIFTPDFIYSSPVVIDSKWITRSDLDQKLSLLSYDLQGNFMDTVFVVPEKENVNVNMREINSLTVNGQNYIYFILNLKEKINLETYKELFIINLTDNTTEVVSLGSVDEIEEMIILPENELLYVLIESGKSFCIQFSKIKPIVWSKGFNSSYNLFKARMNTENLYIQSDRNVYRIFKGNGNPEKLYESNMHLLSASDEFVMVQDYAEIRFLKSDDGTYYARSSQKYNFIKAFHFPSDIIVGINSEGVYGLKIK